ncbi:uncharacterized protein [Diadema setosum]|uniref:uncharacterized protein n=1 Tax=Diadema setosum TaxID=31175 RepID=UPI003B3A2E9C
MRDMEVRGNRFGAKEMKAKKPGYLGCFESTSGPQDSLTKLGELSDTECATLCRGLALDGQTPEAEMSKMQNAANSAVPLRDVDDANKQEFMTGGKNKKYKGGFPIARESATLPAIPSGKDTSKDFPSIYEEIPANSGQFVPLGSDASYSTSIYLNKPGEKVNKYGYVILEANDGEINPDQSANETETESGLEHTYFEGNEKDARVEIDVQHSSYSTTIYSSKPAEKPDMVKHEYLDLGASDSAITLEKFARVQELQFRSEYTYIERNGKPLEKDHNDSSFSASVYSSKDIEKSEVDKHGYLLLDENCAQNNPDHSGTSQEPKSLSEHPKMGENVPLVQEHKDPSYLAAVCSSKRREEPETDRHGNLVPEENTGQINSDDSLTSREPKCLPENAKISKREKCTPPMKDINDPLYSASIDPSKHIEKPELDAHGYLVLEANATHTIDCSKGSLTFVIQADNEVSAIADRWEIQSSNEQRIMIWLQSVNNPYVEITVEDEISTIKHEVVLLGAMKSSPIISLGNKLRLGLYTSDPAIYIPSDECAIRCRERRQDSSVAVIRQGACLCVPSDTFNIMSSSDTYLHDWSCPRMEELTFRPDVYYAFDVSYGFCDQFDIVINGRWDSNTAWFGSLVNLTCHEGYVVKGGTTLQCAGQSGRSTYFPVWNSSVPYCEAVDTLLSFVIVLSHPGNKSTCGHPGNVPHGKWNANTTLLGSLVTLHCDDGYFISGSATLLCMTSSDDDQTSHSLVWNASTPYCQAVARKCPNFPGNKSKCDHPGNVSHGKWYSNATLNGNMVFTLHCDEGYTLNGNATLLCIAPFDSGLSSHSSYSNVSTPTCQLVEVPDNKPKCRHPGDVSHGKWDSNITWLGSIVSLNCDEGYVVSGNSKLQCVGNSVESPSTHPPVWNASIPICQAVGSTGVSLLLISLTSSLAVFVILLCVITTVGCLYRRKRYKTSSNPSQIDNDLTLVTGSRAINVAVPLYTMVPSVSQTTSAEGYPVPAGAEDSAFDPDHIYQDADEVRRNVAEMHRISESSVLVEGDGNNGSSTEQLPFTSDQSLGAECQLGRSHLMPSSGAEEYEQLKFPFTVTSGQGTAMKQARLFDATEYNSLESTRGPVIGHSPHGTSSSHAMDLSSAFDSDDYSQLNRPLDSLRRGCVYDKSDESAGEMAPNCAASLGNCAQLYASVQKRRDGLSENDSSIEASQSITEDEKGASATPVELYAKVDKTRDKFSQKDSSVSARRLEELYAKVDKQVNGTSKENSFIDGQEQTATSINGAETAPVDLYVNVDMRGGNFLEEDNSVPSCMLDELYAKVDKQTDGRSMENGSIGRKAETTRDDTAPVELYVNVDKRDGDFPKEDSFPLARGCEELYAKVGKQRDRRSNGNGSSDGHQGTAEGENVSGSSALEIYATVD